jgi:hypothetical protein
LVGVLSQAYALAVIGLSVATSKKLISERRHSFSMGWAYPDIEHIIF